MEYIYLLLSLLFFLLFVLSLFFANFRDKDIYLLGALFIIPTVYFGFLYLQQASSHLAYLEEEKRCGSYVYSSYAVSSRPPYPKEYFIKFDGLGTFGFRSDAYPNRVVLDNFKKGQKVCLMLKPRNDKPNDLSLAQLVSLEEVE